MIEMDATVRKQRHRLAPLQRRARRIQRGAWIACTLSVLLLHINLAE